MYTFLEGVTFSGKIFTLGFIPFCERLPVPQNLLCRLPRLSPDGLDSLYRGSLPSLCLPQEVLAPFFLKKALVLSATTSLCNAAASVKLSTRPTTVPRRPKKRNSFGVVSMSSP